MTTDKPSPRLPTEVEYLATVAARHLNAGDLTAAAAAYRRILAIQPAYAPAHNDLANLHCRLGQFDQAKAHYRQALAIQPGLFQAHNNLGNLLRAEGQVQQAVDHFRQAIALKPDFTEAHNNLGVVLGAQGQLAEAQACFEQAVALQPANPEAHCNLGKVLGELEQFERAELELNKAVTLKPDYAVAFNNLGNVFGRQGKYGLAVPHFRRALALDPHYAVAHHNLANALRGQGSFDQALSEFDAALAIEPKLTEAYYHRADLKTFRQGDADLATLEAVAADSDRLPPLRRAYVHFALGKALDDIGQYDRAFDQWSHGNRIERSLVRYDEDADAQILELAARLIGPRQVEQFSSAGDPSPAPVFIVGMPRSGTTLIEQILASHPAVFGAGELAALGRVASGITDSTGQAIPFPHFLRSASADELRRIGQAYLAQLPPLPTGATRITDKMPGNYLYVGLIRLILPNAKIVSAVRHPLDTCVSCYSKLFATGQLFTYDLAELGRMLVRYNRLMDHWRAILPAGSMLDVHYEDVVDHFEEQVRRLLDFCELPWDDHCLRFYETSRPITSASNVQVRRPLYRGSVGRWQHYAKHLGPLLAEIKGLVPGV